MRRLVPVLGATLAMAACQSDQVGPTNVPPLTTAQLALYYDSLAGALSPSDPRINWLQQIDNALALGAPRTPIEIDVNGRAGSYWAVVTGTIGNGFYDSTYVMAAWEGALKPFDFLILVINFMRDTAVSQVTYFPDSTASGLAGDTTVAGIQHTVVGGHCTPVKLVHLMLPTGQCSLISTEIGYQSSINGMPLRFVQGVRVVTPSR